MLRSGGVNRITLRQALKSGRLDSFVQQEEPPHIGLVDARPFFVKDGHYVMKMAKPKLPAAAAFRTAATK